MIYHSKITTGGAFKIVDYTIPNVGTASVDKNLECDFSISADEFFDRYSAQVASLSPDAKELLREAIDTGKRQKAKSEQDELNAFFEKVESSSTAVSAPAATSAGWEEPPAVERTLATGTGEGQKVGIVIEEKREIHQDKDGKEIADDMVVNGALKVVNPSAKDRIWDVNLKLAKTERTNIEEPEVYVREVQPEDEFVQEFTIEDDEVRHLALEEFISTVGDPEQPAYFLSVGQENPILLKIRLNNISKLTLLDLKLEKEMGMDYTNLDITSPSAGEAHVEDGKIVWEIPQMEPSRSGPLELEIRASATVDSKEKRVRTGTVQVSYSVETNLSGIDIETFEAFTNNRYFLNEEELEDAPDTFRCQFMFQNTSEFMLQLLGVEVYDPSNPDEKFIDFAPVEDEVPMLSSGAEWSSDEWDIATETGELSLAQNCRLSTLADFKIASSSILTIDDIELGVAEIAGELTYDVEVLNSYAETPFTANHKLMNTGGTPLNEASIKDVIPEGFKPPAVDEIRVLVNGEEVSLDDLTPEPLSDEEIEDLVEKEYKKRAAEVADDPEAQEALRDEIRDQVKQKAEEDAARPLVSVDPEDQESSPVHTVLVDLRDLKRTKNGLFNPDDTIEVIFPLIADKPERGANYVSDAVYEANTDPAGTPLRVIPEAGQIEIPVEHVRKKLLKGKDIRGIGGKGEYEIKIFMKNIGEFALENLVVRDKVPDNFEYSDMSIEPEITDLEGEDILEWTFDKVEPGEEREITYRISGSGEYRASDAQYSM